MERCDLYDADGCLTGKTLLRGEPVPEGCYRMVASVLCIHKDGTVLLMQRHPSKPTHPGLYEASAGGSVLAGEMPLDAAIRELYEETGITATDVTPLYEERSSNCIYRCFLALVDRPKDSVRLQAGETTAYMWASRQELAKLLHEQPSPVVLHRSIIQYLQLEREV